MSDTQIEASDFLVRADSRIVAVTEAKGRLSALVKESDERDVVILNHNRPAAVMLSVRRHAELIEALEDAEDSLAIVDRADEESVDFESIAMTDADDVDDTDAEFTAALDALMGTVEKLHIAIAPSTMRVGLINLLRDQWRDVDNKDVKLFTNGLRDV